MWKLKYLALAVVISLKATAAESQDAAGLLLEKYSSLEQSLHQNQFGRPVVLDSREAGNQVAGEVYAILNHPFAAVSEGLNNPDHWCDVLSLHINTKYCRAVVKPGVAILKVNFGRKTPQALQDAARIEFTYTAQAASRSYLSIKLGAKQGALGSSDYHIGLEAVPLPDGNTFLHFTYSYSINFATRFATGAYLATIGSNKPGFTIIGTDRSGQPQYIGGVRGIIERNTMRYYLAIDSFFAATSQSASEQLEQRLQSWFAATEAYPLQLHELGRDEYFSMKRAESLRQQTED